MFNQPQALAIVNAQFTVVDTGNSLIRNVNGLTVQTMALKLATTSPGTPTTNPTTGSVGYGGGAPSLWFYAALSLLGISRRLFRQRD